MQTVILILCVTVMLVLLVTLWHVCDMSASCREIIGFVCRRIIISLDRKDGYEDIEIRSVNMSDFTFCSEQLQDDRKYDLSDKQIGQKVLKK